MRHLVINFVTGSDTIRDALKTPAQEPIRARNAFTLLEIMIVLGVIGLLALVAVPGYRKAREQSRIKTAKATLEMIASAVRRLTWDTGKWPNGAALATPGSTEMWTMTSSSAGLLAATASYAGWRGPYLRKIEIDPWGNPYFFDPDFRVGGVNYIVVGSFGPNRVGKNLYDSDDIYVKLP